MISRYKFFIFLLASILSTHCLANDDRQSACDKWITKSIKAVESVPPQSRVKVVMAQIQNACKEAIPIKLKQAASEYLKVAS